MNINIPPIENEKSVAKLMYGLHRLLGGLKNEAFSKEGISFPQTLILGFLKHNEERKINMKSLQEVLHIKASSVTSLVDTMQKNGLIEREQNPNDARENLIKLTEKGKIMAEKVESILEDMDEKAFSVLSKKETTTLRNLLLKVINGLKEEK